MKDSTLADRRLSILSRIILLGLWFMASEIIDNEILFPTVGSTLASLIAIIKDPGFFNTISHSILRSLFGFLISLFLAMILGILSCINKFIYNFMRPILNFLSSVPTMAIIILALIWFKNDYVPIFVAFLMVFPILYETVQGAILNVDKNILEMAKIYQVDLLTIIKDIYIPSVYFALNQVFISALSTTLKMVIAGEALSQPKFAIGSDLQLEKMYLNTSGVFAWIIIILIISKLLEYLAKGLRNIYNRKKWK